MSLELNEFFLPEHGDEVVELLEQYGDDALILGGGTFIHSLDVWGLLSGVKLIDIQKLALDTVESGLEGLRVGATARCAVLTRGAGTPSDPWLGAVHDAATHLPLQVRNTATVGGCIAAASPFFDLPVAFMALDGVVTARGSRGLRRIAVGDLFAGLLENSLERGEFLEELRLPQAPPGSVSAFVKLARNANDLAIVNAAVQLTLDASGSCTGARVVLGGGVGSAPVRSASAERVLEGAKLDEDTLRAAGEAAVLDVDPISDHRASSWYRKVVAGVLVRRALERAIARVT